MQSGICSRGNPLKLSGLKCMKLSRLKNVSCSTAIFTLRNKGKISVYRVELNMDTLFLINQLYNRVMKYKYSSQFHVNKYHQLWSLVFNKVNHNKC